MEQKRFGDRSLAGKTIGKSQLEGAANSATSEPSSRAMEKGKKWEKREEWGKAGACHQ